MAKDDKQTTMIQIRNEDLRKLKSWGEKLDFTPERMLSELIDLERRRRAGRSS